MARLRLLIIMPALTLLILGLPVKAAVTDNTWEFITGYNYQHLQTGLPAGENNLFPTDLNDVFIAAGYSCLNSAGQFQFSLEGTGSEDDFNLNLQQLAWTGRVNQFLYEVGKKKWLWGKGFYYLPTCPLDQNTNYWGAEGSLVWLNNSFTVGAALGKDYYTDFESNDSTAGTVADKDYTGWLRYGLSFDTSDFATVVTYQGAQNYLNLGFDYSQDFLNGFEFHGGINFRNSDCALKYLLGGEYSSKYLYIVEFYHDSDNQFIFAISNSAAMFGKWQWQCSDILSLSDYGEIRQFDLKYIKNNSIVPELIVSMNSGPKSSYFQQNPYDYSVILMATMKF